MKKIILDGKEVGELVPESLPMLIHGENGFGSSMYTICLAAKWYVQKSTILFLCGFPMAEEAFRKEVEGRKGSARFYTKEHVTEFLNTLAKAPSNAIVIVKNIELFDNNVWNVIKNHNHLIVSGNITESPLKVHIMEKQFTTEVYFSPLAGKQLPKIEKYHGIVLSGDYKGITQLQ